MNYDDTKNLIKNCFSYRPSLTAREIHFKTGRLYPCQEVYKVLDELESEGYIGHTIVKGTKYIKPHYKYFKTSDKQSILERICNLFLNIFQHII